MNSSYTSDQLLPFIAPPESIQKYIGQTFNQLTAIGYTGKLRGGRKTVVCRCSCGRYTDVKPSNLTSARPVKSCGHLKTESTRKMGKANTTHGMTNSSEFSIWQGMINRCRDSDKTSYGKKGITVCERWKVFENFLEDVGPRPSMQHTNDRIDSDKGYYKENFRWAIHKVQSRNQSHILKYELNGVSKTLADWADEYGMRPSLVYDRMTSRIKNPWTLLEALTIPAGAPRKIRGDEDQETILRRSYDAMIARCRTSKYYIQQGIKVCIRWQADFNSFREDILRKLGYRPSRDHSLHRVGGGKEYNIETVIWALKDVQSWERKDTIYLTLNDACHPLTRWAAIVGLHPATIRDRLRKYKWSVDEALGTPPGECKQRSKWSEKTGFLGPVTERVERFQDLFKESL